MRAQILLIGLLLYTAAPSQLHAAKIGGETLPPTMAVSGQSLTLNGCGTREALFANIYVAGLYLPQEQMSQERILSAQTAKAVRLHIVYDGTLPNGIPESWREPLDSMVQQELRQTLKEIYQKFEAGDRITLTYAPDQGTVISINGKEIRDTQGYALMDPLLRLWIGDKAVSQNLRRLLLKGECQGGGDGLF